MTNKQQLQSIVGEKIAEGYVEEVSGFFLIKRGSSVLFTGKFMQCYDWARKQ